MTKLLITEVEANILRVSNFIGKPGELGYVYNLLKKHNNIYENDVKDESRILEIKHRVNDWVRVSLGEWRVDNTRSPYEIKNKEKDGHQFKCAFCNRNLKSIVYYASNRTDGRYITLGSSCVQKLGDNEFMASAHVANNDREQSRYEHLIKKYPRIEYVMNAGRNKILLEKYVLPQELINRFWGDFDLLKRYVRSYLKIGSFTRESRKMQEKLNNYNKTCKLIEEYQNKCMDKPNFHLDKDTVHNEEKINKEKIKEIKKEVEKNNGIMRTDLAANMMSVPYLDRIKRTYDHNENISSLNITVVDNGLFNVTFKIDSISYKFNVSSKRIISLFGFPQLNDEVPSGLNIAKAIGNHFEPDESTKFKLLEDSIIILGSEMELTQLSFGAANIWNNSSRQQENWFKDEYGKYIIFKDGSNVLTLLDSKDMIEIALWYELKLKEMKEIMEFIKYKSIKYSSKKELIDGIKNSYDVSQSFY
ncbi:hypothetical protein FC72_GL002043 [Companilactobacillus tucceti DSM 20183]|uniref:Uncharacterized protein n=1 Tax=Companilactobacillus tucceti DSM 20183 TaxID=1423811 RepID=A0A0R1J0P1_9LACO|nr:hypothetical protein [Companilactobacillus tucceti]KRK64635.1 hypothetical protein FC72_GL002043 [Companilactobacillus tucceti DSM 20183]